MQVFLPSNNSYEESVLFLDNTRLQKQLLETTQLLAANNNLKTLDGKQYKGWTNHPAATAFKNYSGALAHYGYCCAMECKKRNIKHDILLARVMPFIESNFRYPNWHKYIDKISHTHRCRLIQKSITDSEKKRYTYFWYKSLDWPEFQMDQKYVLSVEYIWPIINNEINSNLVDV